MLYFFPLFTNFFWNKSQIVGGDQGEVRPIPGRQLIERLNGVRGQMDGFALGSDGGFLQVKPPFHKV